MRMPNIVDWMVMSSNPDFSYGKFVEESHHAETVAIAIDSSTRQKIASDEEISQRGMQHTAAQMSQLYETSDQQLKKLEGIRVENAQNASDMLYALGGVEQTISSGNELILGSLSSVREAIEDGSDIIVRELGFLGSMLDQRLGGIATQLGTLNTSMAELVKIAKTPSQTWAFEQFELARDAYRRHLFDEAFEAIDRAINGYRDQVGNKLEHRFYLLKGIMHLGGADVGNHGHVDLDAAQKNFNLAIRYSKGVMRVDYAESLKLLGWSYICDGKFDEARQPLFESVRLDTIPSAEAHFLNAKITAFDGDLDKSKIYLTNAICLNPDYAIKAFSDEHLVSNETEHGLIDGALNEAAKRFRTSILHFSDRINTSLSELREVVEEYDFEKIILSPDIKMETDVDLNQATIFTLKKIVRDGVGSSDLIEEIRRSEDSIKPHFKAHRLKLSSLMRDAESVAYRLQDEIEKQVQETRSAKNSVEMKHSAASEAQKKATDSAGYWFYFGGFGFWWLVLLANYNYAYGPWIIILMIITGVVWAVVGIPLTFIFIFIFEMTVGKKKYNEAESFERKAYDSKIKHIERTESAKKVSLEKDLHEIRGKRKEIESQISDLDKRFEKAEAALAACLGKMNETRKLGSPKALVSKSIKDSLPDLS